MLLFGMANSSSNGKWKVIIIENLENFNMLNKNNFLVVATC